MSLGARAFSSHCGMCLMLIKVGKNWIDPTTVRGVSVYKWNYEEGVRIHFKSQGGEVPNALEYMGIKVDEAAQIINEALSNRLFYGG